MVGIHDHFRPPTAFNIQHHARLGVLNVECHLHKQDHLYNREHNVAAYAAVLDTPTVSTLVYSLHLFLYNQQ